MYDNDEEARSFVNICSFCGKEIQLSPMKCVNSNYTFCDICCAKLYYDNIDKVVIDYQDYHECYRTNQLSALARRIYESTESCLFEMLPICKVDVDDKNFDPQMVKNKYLNIYMH